MDKPQKPIKYVTVREEIDIYDCTLEEVLEKVPPGISFRDIEFGLEHEDNLYYSDYALPVMYYYVEKENEDYEKQMLEYEAKLVEYKAEQKRLADPFLKVKEQNKKKMNAK